MPFCFRGPTLQLPPRKHMDNSFLYLSILLLAVRQGNIARERCRQFQWQQKKHGQLVIYTYLWSILLFFCQDLFYLIEICVVYLKYLLRLLACSKGQVYRNSLNKRKYIDTVFFAWNRKKMVYTCTLAKEGHPVFIPTKVSYVLLHPPTSRKILLLTGCCTFLRCNDKGTLPQDFFSSNLWSIYYCLMSLKDNWSLSLCRWPKTQIQFEVRVSCTSYLLLVFCEKLHTHKKTDLQEKKIALGITAWCRCSPESQDLVSHPLVPRHW